MFYTYALYSHDHDKIYIGMTNDLERRLYDHNERSRGWTSRYRPWVIIYSEIFETKSMALKRERELKTARGRAFIRQQIDPYTGSVG